MKRRFLVTVDANEKYGKGKLRKQIAARLYPSRLIQSVTVAYAPDPVKAAPKRKAPTRKPALKPGRTAFPLRSSRNP